MPRSPSLALQPTPLRVEIATQADMMTAG